MTVLFPTRRIGITIAFAIGMVTNLLHAEQAVDSVPAAFGNYNLVDVQSVDKDEVVFLGLTGPMRVNQTTPSQYSVLFKNKGNTVPTHLELFRVPGQPPSAGYLSIAYLDRGRKNGAGIYQYLSGERKFVAHIQSRLKEPTFFQAPNDDVFIGSRTGVVYRLHEGKIQSYNVQQEPLEPNFRRSYRPFHFVTAPAAKDGPVCCYSIADPAYHKHALLDVLVTEGDGWRRISLAGEDGTPRRTGPACMTDAKTLRMLSYDRWTNIDLATGKATSAPFATPGDGKVKIKPTELFVLPDGTMISLWRKLYRSPKKNDVDAFANDKYHRIAEWKNDHWQFAPIGLDRRIRATHPYVIDPSGGWWVVSGEGSLVYRSPEGEYREFDYRYGVPPAAVKRLRMTGNYLWVLGDRSSVFRFDTTELIQKPKPPENRVQGDWQVVDAQTQMSGFRSSSFRMQPLLGLSGKILNLHWGDDGSFQSEQIDLPEFKDYDLQVDFFHIYRDSRGTPWIIPYPSTGLKDLARYVNGEWQRIGDSKDAEGFRLSPFETAAAKLLDEGYGDGDFAPQIAFGSNGDAAVISDDRMGYFNGTKWIEAVLPDRRVRTVVFDAGDIVLKQNANAKTGFRLDKSAWDEDTPRDKFPWQSVAVLSDQRQSRDAAAAILKTCPTVNIFSHYCVNGRLLAVSKNDLAVYHREHWTVIANENSPLGVFDKLNRRLRFNRQGLYGFGVGSKGELVVHNRTEPVHTYAILPPTPLTVTQGTTDLGEVVSEDATLKPDWKSSLDAEAAIHRYRVDGGPWSEWLSTEQPTVQPGLLLGKKHILEIQLGSRKQIVRTDNLKYDFAVGYDAQPRFDELIKQLGDKSFKVREAAEKELLKFGQNFPSKLRSVAETTGDAEVKTRLQYILETLPKPAAIDD